MDCESGRKHCVLHFLVVAPHLFYFLFLTKVPQLFLFLSLGVGAQGRKE